MNLNFEKRYWKKGDVVVGIDEAGRGCERPDAEILTNHGWKRYNDIDIMLDKILSYRDDGVMVWQEINSVVVEDFKGELVQLKNRSVDIVVTPDHSFTVLRRVFKRNKRKNNKLELIGYKTRKKQRCVTDLVANDFIPRGGEWLGRHKDEFILPGINGFSELVIDMEQWVAFIGIFLAEGSTHADRRGNYKIEISQSIKAHPSCYSEIQDLLCQLPFNFRSHPTGFTCLNKQLFSYLEQLGNCYTKFIPSELKDLSSRYLKILIKWLLLGDGASYKGKNRKRVWVYYTVSSDLRDDFEEVLLKSGWTFKTTIRMPRDRFIGDRKIKKENCSPCYEVRLRRNNKITVKHLQRASISYQDKVFCLQLPKYHNFYVRRSGSGYFTGNSLAGPVAVCALTMKKVKAIPDELLEVNDSKKLSSTKRDRLYWLLSRHPLIDYEVSWVSPSIIDRINILEATRLAMKRAVNRLVDRVGDPEMVLVDGRIKLDVIHPQLSVTRGDERVFSCAAASIVAKVFRDRTMDRYDKLFPQYGFKDHKGYGTEEHVRMLKKYGPCRIHRKSFNGVDQNKSISKFDNT